tara:strand:- start:426 stop:1790 length:1365 start_codon:yes stop_codon:yes gene_type:complete
MESFEEVKNFWLEQTEKIKPKENLKNLVFIVVYPNEEIPSYVAFQWDFAMEKQMQITLLQTSGGVTGDGTGHNQKICYLTELNDVLETCANYSHAMIVSIGMVFDMLCSVTAIQRFYDWSKTGEFCKAHIIVTPDKKAFIHHQHIELNLDKWRQFGKPNMRAKWEKYDRAEDNFRDVHTPSWINVPNLPTITTFSGAERKTKTWSYGHMPKRREIQDKNWNIINNKQFGWRENVDRDDPYFQILFTRLHKIFYLENTESLGNLPDRPFNLILTPTAGYSGEVFVDRLDFDGEIVFYDYCSENIEIKQNIVEKNMSMKDIQLYAKNFTQIIAPNNVTPNQKRKAVLNERTKSYGTHEELRALQEKMYNNYKIDYKVWDAIGNAGNDWFINKIKGKKVFMDISNIYGYHTSHACYRLSDLKKSFDKMVETLDNNAEYYYLKGTDFTKESMRRKNNY